MIHEEHRRQVLDAQESHRPLVITTHSYLPATQTYVDRLLRLFLAELGIEALFDPLSFCVRELAVNAKKANTKRLYFQARGLDPHHPDDYRLGMAHFKQDTLHDQVRYRRLLAESGLRIRIEFLRWGRTCSLAVRNNVEVVPEELARVREKVRAAQQASDLESLVTGGLDESEGAGLGLAVLILLLKRLGFTGEFFQFYTRGGETVARIILPLSLD